MSLLDLNSGRGSSPRLKRGVKLWVGAGFVAAVVGIGSTLASSITINATSPSEFGQGVERIVYCGGESSVLTVTPISAFKNQNGTTDSTAGNFYLSGVKVSGIPDACDDTDFVISIYKADGSATPLTISSNSSLLTPSNILTQPTVYWKANLEMSGSKYTWAGATKESAPTDSSACQTASTLIKVPSGGDGALLSALRSSYVNPCSVAYLTVANSAFQINFKTGSGITNTDVGPAGRIVIETQEDTFGLANTKTKDSSGLYGLTYDGLS